MVDALIQIMLYFGILQRAEDGRRALSSFIAEPMR